MQELYETSDRFSSSRKIGLVLFFVTLISIPVTITLVNNQQGSEQFAAKECIERPACLDASPACQLPVPKTGWCHHDVSSTTPGISPMVVVTTPTPTPLARGSAQECSKCLTQNQQYSCLNQTTNKKFCFSVAVRAPGYTCVICN